MLRKRNDMHMRLRKSYRFPELSVPLHVTGLVIPQV
jgi:hypothetical protein